MRERPVAMDGNDDRNAAVGYLVARHRVNSERLLSALDEPSSCDPARFRVETCRACVDRDGVDGAIEVRQLALRHWAEHHQAGDRRHAPGGGQVQNRGRSAERPLPLAGERLET